MFELERLGFCPLDGINQSPELRHALLDSAWPLYYDLSNSAVWTNKQIE